MKNASAKNTVAVLYAVVMALALSVGAFAGTAHAQYEDYSGDNFGYLGGSSPDTGWYDVGSEYTPDTGWYDVGSEYTPDTGWYDVGSEYTPDTGWYDVGSEYTPSYDTTSCDCYSTPTYSSYSSPSSYYSSALAPVYSNSYVPQVARQAISYAVQSSPVFIPQQPNFPQPTFAATAPTNNVNTNTNTNVNTPTFVATATNTNTNTPVASVSNSGNSSASTGPITNTFAPVINVGNTAPQHQAVATFPRPYCTITSSGSYGPNQLMTLTWSSSNASSAYISPNVGTVNTNGSTTVYPNGYTTYTMTVTGQGGSATCQTVANYAVAPIQPVTPVYTAQPASPYVSLSQIPYTGFDYGTVGNAIYWTALISFAVAAGYLLVYGFPKVAFAGFTGAAKNDAFGGSEDLKEARLNDEVGQVFKSKLVPATEMALEDKSFSLPVATSSHGGVTSDAMIIDRNASGSPRIVIARS